MAEIGISIDGFTSANAILQLHSQARFQLLDILPVIQRYTLHHFEAIDKTGGNVASTALATSASFHFECCNRFVNRATPSLIEFAKPA